MSSVKMRCAYCGIMLSFPEFQVHQCQKRPTTAHVKWIRPAQPTVLPNVPPPSPPPGPEKTDISAWLSSQLEETVKRQAREINKLSLLMGETMKDLAAAINYITSGLPRSAEKKLRERWNANSEILGKVDEG